MLATRISAPIRLLGLLTCKSGLSPFSSFIYFLKNPNFFEKNREAFILLKYEFRPCCLDRKSAALTNVGHLLERRGKEFLGSLYVDPISSFSAFQEFSVSNPEVGIAFS